MKRDTRSIWAIVQEPPVHSEKIGADIVEVNTNEAKKLIASRATVERSTTILKHKMQTYLYGGKLYLWIAGVTSASADDDYPVPLQSPAT